MKTSNNNYRNYKRKNVTSAILRDHPDWYIMHLGPTDIPGEAGEYIIVQDAYIAGTINNPYYESYALRVGEETITEDDKPLYDGLIGDLAYYRVVWEIIPEYADNEDASTHCDWHRPLYIEYVGTL